MCTVAGRTFGLRRYKYSKEGEGVVLREHYDYNMLALAACITLRTGIIITRRAPSRLVMHGLLCGLLLILTLHFLFKLGYCCR